MRVFRRAAVLTMMSLLALSAAQASGGGSSASAPSQGPVVTPEEIAIDNYNQGLGHRDKAWKLEAQLATASEGKKTDKLNAKISKEYKKAIRNFETAVQNRPGFYQALSSLGYAHRKTGDYEGSLGAYERALALAPDYLEAVEYQAEAHLALGRVEEAKQAYLRLFAGDRAKADQLMTAMKGWVAEQRSNDQTPAGLGDLEAWISSREEIAVQSAKLSQLGSDRDW